MRLPILALFLLPGNWLHLASCSPTNATPIPDLSPTISTPVGNFSGQYSSTYNITYYRKIPFAAPPTGVNRFRAPQPAAPITNGTYNTDQSFDPCVQSTGGVEDCLYLGLYSRPWKTGAKRPVVVEIHGGAYSAGSASFNIPPFGYPTLNASKDNDFIFVYPAYRLNVFGFLPGNDLKIASDADLNVGLLDQQATLKWVHENIEYFGGDPDNVAIWGQSAGGGSVLAHAIANGGKTEPKLFNKALASSPYWVKQYAYNDPETQWVYDSMVNLTGCTAATVGARLSCLRSLDYQTLFNATRGLTAYKPWYTAYSLWGPVVDDTFLLTRLSAAVSQKKLNANLAWGMSNTHEGERFISQDLNLTTSTSVLNSSTAAFDYWLRGYLPHFNDSQLAQVKELYQAAGLEDTGSYNGTYQRAGLIYRDTVLSCSGFWVAGAAEKGWQGEFTILPAVHGTEQVYVCGEPGYNSTCAWNTWPTTNPSEILHYLGLAGGFSSFLQAGDPNALKLTNSSEAAVPEVDTGLLWTMNEDGFKNVERKWLDKRCKFWRELGSLIPA